MDENTSKLNFCYNKIVKNDIKNFNSFNKFCEINYCGKGCFLKFLKLSPHIQEIIWDKLGHDNFLGEIKELHFEKLFSIYRFDPCRISLFLSNLNKKEDIDYNVSCFSVGLFSFYLLIYYI